MLKKCKGTTISFTIFQESKQLMKSVSNSTYIPNTQEGTINVKHVHGKVLQELFELDDEMNNLFHNTFSYFNHNLHI